MQIVSLSRLDHVRIYDHLVRLSSESRMMRFFSAVSDNSIESYVNKIRWDRDLCVGAFIDATLVGFVHLAINKNSDIPEIEIGISVDDDQRGKGIGWRLMSHVMLVCKSMSPCKLRIETAQGNQGMIGLARSCGMNLHHEEDCLVASVNIDVGNEQKVFHLMEKWISESIGFTELSIDRAVPEIVRDATRRIRNAA